MGPLLSQHLVAQNPNYPVGCWGEAGIGGKLGGGFPELEPPLGVSSVQHSGSLALSCRAAAVPALGKHQDILHCVFLEELRGGEGCNVYLCV